MSKPPVSSSAARDALRSFAPKLVDLTDNVLFGDVWERPGLSKRDRSLITCAALIALNRTEQQTGHFQRAPQQRREEGGAAGGDHASRLLRRLAGRHVGGQRRQEGVGRGRPQVKLCYFNDYRLGVIKGRQRRRRHRCGEGHPAPATTAI